ncbi:siroheme synthase CysG [Curvivirga sp.]|uniref:siroheme synthase CysG n=1 Tax=Curvivirga sp. TaxID=2856848 RepID=UPI003B5A7FBE
MSYFPLFMTMKARPALVIGGDELAARKVRLLEKASARIHVMAVEMCCELQEKAESGKIEWLKGETPHVISSEYAFVVSATGIDELDREVSEKARESNVPVNVVDRPELSDFIFPAIIDRSPVMVAVSSGGTAPVLARRIRAQIETLLPTNIGRLADLSEKFRGAVKALFPTERQRRAFWERYFDGEAASNFLAGNEDDAQEKLMTAVNDASNGKIGEGRVLLVGAGPGDPDLLTMRAFRALQNADLIVTDRLVDDRILDLARRDAERLYVGKEKGKHTVHQSLINRVIASAAQKGQTVVRLKGGDPFIFGRGGEEMAYLEDKGISVEIVPGITAATGAAAAANIPLTHRDFASSVSFITGHVKDGGEEPDWDHLASSRQTLVFYMGIDNAGRISGKLMQAGLPADMPAAIIENATRPNQRVIKGSLAGLEAMILANNVQSPALLVIGEVTRFAKTDFNKFITNNKESSAASKAAV